MIKKWRNPPPVQLDYEPDDPRRVLPKRFWDIITRRYLPVLSLTYMSSVAGFAASDGNLIEELFHHEKAYVKGLFVAAWVSVPAIMWILIKGMPMYKHVAEDWYKIMSAIMVITLMMSYVLFPEVSFLGLRQAFVASLPILVVQYLFFVKGGLHPSMAYPLSAMGLGFLIYGAAINFLY